MNTQTNLNNKSLINYSESLSELYTDNININERKQKGQIFTPMQVSSFMAKLFKINKTQFNLLDPGAGTGILTSAFCNQLVIINKRSNINIDVYENDTNLLPLLKKNLLKCKQELEDKGYKINFSIYSEDFILKNAKYFRKDSLFNNKDNQKYYDYIISNPPYYKLNKNSLQAKVIPELISGQPNIYALFMGISASLLKSDGEMVFITPRSFCSGLYYKKFREWLLNNIHIEHIHIFESRKEVFDKDKILQENIIIKAKKTKNDRGNKKIYITTSYNRKFDKFKKFQF